MIFNSYIKADFADGLTAVHSTGNKNSVNSILHTIEVKPLVTLEYVSKIRRKKTNK